jgi:molecular chaperone GrpE
MTSDSKTNDDQNAIERLRTENEQLREELRREHEIYLRSVADFDNYRRRIDREQTTAARTGKREIVLSLLEILDDFEHALAHLDRSPASVSVGLRAIHRRLVALLEVQGVTPFESLGHPFDPALHEAVGSEESEQQEPGTVLDELSTGYRWGGELLRPARVRVAR